MAADTLKALSQALKAVGVDPLGLRATLEDAVAGERRPNLPGTTVATNWSVPLPLAEVLTSPLARDVAAVLAGAVSGGVAPSEPGGAR